MRYLRRTTQSGSNTNNSELIMSLIKKVIETFIANATANNNQQIPRENNNFNQNKEANVRKAPTQNSSRTGQGGKEASNDQEDDQVNGVNNVSTDDEEQKVIDYPETRLNEYEEILAHVKNKGIAEVIKEIYHGVTITVSLINGQSINGEVIGLYNNILILRNAGILSYIKGEAIVSFF